MGETAKRRWGDAAMGRCGDAAMRRCVTGLSREAAAQNSLGRSPRNQEISG